MRKFVKVITFMLLMVSMATMTMTAQAESSEDVIDQIIKENKKIDEKPTNADLAKKAVRKLTTIEQDALFQNLSDKENLSDEEQLVLSAVEKEVNRQQYGNIGFIAAMIFGVFAIIAALLQDTYEKSNNKTHAGIRTVHVLTIILAVFGFVLAAFAIS